MNERTRNQIQTLFLEGLTDLFDNLYYQVADAMEDELDAAIQHSSRWHQAEAANKWSDWLMEISEQFPQVLVGNETLESLPDPHEKAIAPFAEAVWEAMADILNHHQVLDMREGYSLWRPAWAEVTLVKPDIEPEYEHDDGFGDSFEYQAWQEEVRNDMAAQEEMRWEAELYQSQFDDDPSPYDGNYSEE